MVLVVDRGMCIGCGVCEATCPNVFSMDDDGTALAINEDIPEELIADATAAMEDCPVGAISEE